MLNKILKNSTEAILNTDFSTAKGKKDILGNVSEDMANHRTLEVHEKCTDTKTSCARDFENSSVQDASTINDDDWSAEPHHLLFILLPILLVRLVKAQVREWKKEKRRKDPRPLKRIRSHSSFLGTGRPRRSLLSRSQYGGKSFWKIGGWISITVTCGLFFPSSMAASTSPTSKPKNDVVNARVNETLSVSCGGIARSNFRWMRYHTSEGKQERLYKSGDTRNCTNPLMTCLPNGTFIFQSVQVSDMGTYFCIVLHPEDSEEPSTEHVYYLNVQNLTVNHSQVEVVHESIPGSRRHGVIAAVCVFVGIVAIAAVSVFIYCFVSKRRKQKHLKQEQTGDIENGVPMVTDAGATNSSNALMLNGH